METEVKELFGTHIKAAPEVLFEIMCELENENLKHFKPGAITDLYEFDACNYRKEYELSITSWDIYPPLEMMQKISKDMDCEIRIIVYDEEHTKRIRDVKYKSGEAMEV